MSGLPTKHFAQQAGWAGLCAFVLAVASVVASGTPPSPDAAVQDLTAYAHDNRDGVLMAAALFQLALPFVFVFLAGLRRLAAGEDGSAEALAAGGLASGVALQIVALVGQLAFVAILWRGFTTHEQLTLAYDINMLGLYALTSGLSFGSVVLTSLAIWQTRALPLWPILLAAVVAAANVAEVFGLFHRTGFLALGAGPGLIAIPAWILWMAAVSVTMLLRKS